MGLCNTTGSSFSVPQTPTEISWVLEVIGTGSGLGVLFVVFSLWAVVLGFYVFPGFGYFGFFCYLFSFLADFNLISRR